MSEDNCDGRMKTAKEIRERLSQHEAVVDECYGDGLNEEEARRVHLYEELCRELRWVLGAAVS